MPISEWFAKIFPGPITVPKDLRSGAYQQIRDDKEEHYESDIYQEIHAEESDRILRIADSYDENDSHLYHKKYSFSYYHNTTTKPYFLNPFVEQNLAITLSFVDVGIAMYILQTPVGYYLIYGLDASPQQYSSYSTLVNLPWSLKFIFGMISDGFPIFGYRRKSWLGIGWMIFVIICLYLSLMGKPGIYMTTIMMFIMTCAYLLADVCSDTLCVERSRFEIEEEKGTLQTSGYTSRAFGSVIGSILGAILYNKTSWGWGLTIAQLFGLSAFIPLTGVLPALWSLEELASTRPGNAPTIKEQFTDIWQTLQLKAVWRPLSFIFTYYVFQIPNQAWTNFLVKGLGFTDFDIGLLTVASTVFLWLGMIIYKRYFFETSWRSIYIWTTALGAFFSFLQILLILGINKKLGIPDVIFAIGDTGIVYLIYAIQSMPSSIMFIMICPEGSEGITYALLTTIGNLGWTVACAFGSAMTTIWDVSNETLASGDYSGMLNLTLLTSFLQILPLSLVFLLPDSKEEQIKLRDAGITSRVGGFCLGLVVTLSLIGTISLSIYGVIFG